MVGTFPEAWEETAIITIQRKGGTAYQYAAITETVDISEPDQSGETIANVAGGRIWKRSPQEDGEITLELYPVELDTAGNNTGLFQEFQGGDPDSATNAYDTSDPLSTDGTGYTYNAGVMVPRDRFIVAVMWTTDTAQTSAMSATTAADYTALRFYAKACRITSHKTSFTDGVVKTTVTFKFPAFIKAGTTKNFAWESTDDTDTTPLPALTYT